MLRGVFTGLALAVAAARVDAQITTYVVPPRAPAPSPQMVAAADSAQRDSVAKVTMTNMKAWVDSAAGVPVPAHVGDSLALDPGRPDTSTTFADGSVAPATASHLPTLFGLGVASLVVGGGLLRRRRR